MAVDRQVSLTNYLGVTGLNGTSGDGVMIASRAIRLSDVTDGASNTLAVGERPPSPEMWYGWWYSGGQQPGGGFMDFLLGVRQQNFGGRFVWHCPLAQSSYRLGRLDEVCDVFHFWSLHPLGSHFLFCDGSVRLMTYDANAVLPALATRAGGEVADHFE
jgi:prepilin-type processing-associated H-X9-DG protein